LYEIYITYPTTICISTGCPRIVVVCSHFVPSLHRIIYCAAEPSPCKTGLMAFRRRWALGTVGSMNDNGKLKEAQEIQQVDDFHEAIKRQKINDAVAALEAKWDAFEEQSPCPCSACTIPKATEPEYASASSQVQGLFPTRPTPDEPSYTTSPATTTRATARHGLLAGTGPPPDEASYNDAPHDAGAGAGAANRQQMAQRPVQPGEHATALVVQFATAATQSRPDASAL
jgi:hypothetical protein